MKPHIPTLFALGLTAITAPAVEIVVTAEPAGALSVGQEVTINLAARDWNPADPEVDAIAFTVDFDTSVLRFVSGSGQLVKDGGEFLALANQGPDYKLDDDSDESLVDYGRFIVGCTDIGDATAGSIGPSARLGSFRLRAVAPGVTKVQSSANSPTAVFSDPAYYGISPTGGIAFGGVELKVSAPAISYSTWAATVPFASQSDARPEADPEKDGRSNLLEYFFDANPLASDPERSPQVGSVVVQEREFTALVYERPAGILTRTDTSDSGQLSFDAENWATTGIIVHSVSVIDPLTGRETVTLRSSQPTGRFDVELLRLLIRLDSIAVGP